MTMRDELVARIAEALIHEQSAGCCHMDKDCDLCDCGGSSRIYAQDQARAVVAAIEPMITLRANAADAVIIDLDALDGLLGISPDPIAQRVRRQLAAERQLRADLIQRRTDLSLSQAEVAQRMDASVGAVADIENGAVSMLSRYAVSVDATIEYTIEISGQ